MTKPQLIEQAAALGIKTKEITYGIYNTHQVYAIEPVDYSKRRTNPNLYHVTLDTTRQELLTGIRIIAEKLTIKLPAGFTS